MSRSNVKVEKTKGRGRPKMTAIEKAEAKVRRDANKAEAEKNEGWSDNPFNTGQPDKVKEPKQKRPYVQSGVVVNKGVPCFHCRATFGHKKAHKYPNGNQRHICGSCGKPFLVKKVAQ
jgi:hypothetical protein